MTLLTPEQPEAPPEEERGRRDDYMDLPREMRGYPAGPRGGDSTI